MREGLGLAVLVTVLWALVLRGDACDPVDPGALERCRFRPDPDVPGGALCTAERGAEEAIDGRTRLSLGLPLNPNRATIDDLAAVPGIAGRTARAIIDFRTREGPYTAPEDLARVPGLGPARIRALQPYLTFDPSTEVSP
jgi:competence ComEA-like helix-hairpin-helix protein